MSSFDCPDWEHVITINTSATVTDAPDWSDVVTGPSGGPVPGTGGASPVWPPDYGFNGWNSNPFTITSTAKAVQNTRLLGGTIRCVQSATISQVYMAIQAAGSGITANENFIGIYTLSGGTYTLRASSTTGKCDTYWAGTSLAPVTLSSSLAVTAGTLYYIAYLFNGTTAPTTYNINPFGAVTWRSATGFLTPPIFEEDVHTYTTLPATFLQTNLTTAQTLPWSAF